MFRTGMSIYCEYRENMIQGQKSLAKAIFYGFLPINYEIINEDEE